VLRLPRSPANILNKLSEMLKTLNRYQH
jgi:hypothetical protein